MTRSRTEVLPWLGRLLEEFGGVADKCGLCRTALQLLGNLCVGHAAGQEAVWRVCFPDIFRSELIDSGPLNVDTLESGHLVESGHFVF